MVITKEFLEKAIKEQDEYIASIHSSNRPANRKIELIDSATAIKIRFKKELVLLTNSCL